MTKDEMYKELVEKLTAIREDLRALWDSEEVTVDVEGPFVYRRLIKLKDAKELAELLKQKTPTMWLNYKELFPYMTTGQQSRAVELRLMDGMDEKYLTRMAERSVPRLMNDMNDLYETVEWLSSIADQMGCPASELLRYKERSPENEQRTY